MGASLIDKVDSSQNWNHLKSISDHKSALQLALRVLANAKSGSTLPSRLRLATPIPAHMLRNSSRTVELSSSLPLSTQELAHAISLLPSVRVATLVTVNERVLLRPVCPQRFNGWDGSGYWGDYSGNTERQERLTSTCKLTFVFPFQSLNTRQ